ncbi:MAG: hypothetical protein LKF69_03720 [Bacilli bacterium]|jgi:hypothetical protein|nr:hypothetical protein [Bacilli bacterium]MCH4201944.1 hypothetical protein [Bacilli bacterium]MCH4235889.1 hypothetical protein [Bacilli bacterium]
MNNVNSYILGIYQVALIVRDSLEYTVRNRAHEVKAYEERKKGLDILLAEGAPLPQFVKANGEKSGKVLENLHNFQESIYSDKSTIVKVAAEGIRVDDNQHLTVYEQIVGIYQTLIDILQGYIGYTKKENLYDERVDKLVYLDEKFFRVYSILNIVGDIVISFNEFNKLMNEQKGKPSPLSNFVVEDMRKLYGLVLFEKKHNRIVEADFNAAFDQCMALVESMEGKRALPDGKKFPDLFKETNQAVVALLGPAETAWRDQFRVLMAEALSAASKATKTPDSPGGNDGSLA